MNVIVKNSLLFCLALAFFGCKKKESDVLGLKIDDLAQEWILTQIVYTNDETDQEFTFNPYYDITLDMLKGGKYELNDKWGLLNMGTFNGTGFVSKDIQRKYGSWEFTNESTPDQIVFNKGANTYSLHTESNYFDYYVFTDPEYVFNINLENDALTLTTKDYNLMYMYGYYMSNDDAYNYCPSCLYTYDDYNDGYGIGEYYGDAGGYNDGALAAYLDSSKSITVYRKDPFFNGLADGKLQNYYDFDYASIDYSTTPNYESGWIDGYWVYYAIAYADAQLQANRTTSNPGKIELIFAKK